MGKSLILKNPQTIPAGLSMPVGKSLPLAVNRIVQELHPEKIILFGSYANGSPNRDSDVDLLVIWETNLPRDERYLAVSRLLEPRQFPVDIIVMDKEEIRQYLAKGNFFFKEVLEFGQVLYDRK